MGVFAFQENIARKVQSRLHVTEELLQRLGLEKELEGHTGCVNCLEWNSTGEYGLYFSFSLFL